jgi:hypothetical protein
MGAEAHPENEEMISVVEILLEEFILTALLHGKFITL